MHIYCGINEQSCCYVAYSLCLSYGDCANVSCKCFHLLKLLKDKTCAILSKHIFFPGFESNFDMNLIKPPNRTLMFCRLSSQLNAIAIILNTRKHTPYQPTFFFIFH